MTCEKCGTPIIDKHTADRIRCDCGADIALCETCKWKHSVYEALADHAAKCGAKSTLQDMAG